MVNRKNKRKTDGEKIFSIVASLTIVVALVICVVAVVKTTSGKKKNYIDLNTPTSDNLAIVPSSSINETEAPTPVERPTKNVVELPTEEVTEAPSVTVENPTDALEASDVIQETAKEVNAPVYNFSEDSEMIRPVEGDILLNYNMDNTIYFPTLDQYKCNPAVIFAATVGTAVQSAAAGVVEDVYVDRITGTTMVISIGNGYKVIYGQLGELAVGVSDQVMAGTQIGKIAEPTKYFTKEGSNLYFAVTKDGEYVDPFNYIR